MPAFERALYLTDGEGTFQVNRVLFQRGLDDSHQWRLSQQVLQQLNDVFPETRLAEKARKCLREASAPSKASS